MWVIEGEKGMETQRQNKSERKHERITDIEKGQRKRKKQREKKTKRRERWRKGPKGREKKEEKRRENGN